MWTRGTSGTLRTGRALRTHRTSGTHRPHRGRDNFNLFNVKAADYNYFEGITFKNTKIAIWAGTQFIAGSKGLTVKNCRFEDVGMGIFTNHSNSSDFYIADSVFLGRNDPKHLTGWNGPFWAQFEHVEGQQYPPIMESYTGIRLYGPGHVVAHNYVADFHDGIDTDYYGMPDGSHPVDGPNYPPRSAYETRRRRSTSTTTTSPTRTTTRSRWTAACTTSA